MAKLKFLILMLAATMLSAAEQTIQLAKPTLRQMEFADWEVGAFFHYTLNPFTGQEHGDGQEPASKFNPTELDTDQWIRTAKSMGAKYAVLTARHEGGFCLWPTKTTDYSIANSPYKDGKGDLVREFVDSCHKYGMKVGLYHTATFDANAVLGNDYASWGSQKLPLKWNSPERGIAFREAYKRYPNRKKEFFNKQVEQMRELMTWYGPIDFMWSDHWDASDPDGLWRAVTNLAKEIQPNIIFMGPDTWVPGNETGHVVYPLWNAVNTKDGTIYSRPAATEADASIKNNYGLLETDVLTGHPLGKFWRVRECTTNQGFHTGGWFWHPGRTRARSLAEHIDLYYRTVGLGANTIINLPPDTRGLVPDDLVAAAKAFGDEIEKRFSNPIAEIKEISSGDIVELKWATPTNINTIVTMENIANGQKVSKYTFEAMVDGKWKSLEPVNYLRAWRPYNSSPGFETIGHKKIDRVKPVTTNQIRFRCLESVVSPVELRKFSVYSIEPAYSVSDATYPYLSGVKSVYEHSHSGVKRDTNYHGGQIAIGGKSFTYGIMACPASNTRYGVVEFDLARLPKVNGLKAVVGIDDATAGSGSAVFSVEGFKDGKWTELYKSEKVKGGQKGVEVYVKFPVGIEKIALKATDAGDGINSDHAVWADARFTELSEVELTKPTPQQMAFMDMEYGAFVHYGINVYTGQEHGDGHNPPSKFNPTALDTDQWVRTAKALGAKYAVLTARHEGGFCLWPTKTTDYSIANSPYKDGKGDIVRDFVNSCRKYGIKPGLYHTASHDARQTHLRTDDVKWDANLNTLISNNFKRMGEEGRKKYIELQVEQMRELLTNYGDIYYLWCDHWNGQNTTEDDMMYHVVTNEAFRKVTALMRELQPQCVMLGPDVETPGNEQGRVVYPLWNCMDTVDGTCNSRGTGTKADVSVGNDYGLLETDSKTGHPLGKFWRSRECTTNTGFSYGGWFWHPGRTKARTLPEHMDMYYRSMGLGASAIINLPPDNRGLIPDDIVASAEDFGKELKTRFSNPVAEIKSVTKGDVVLAWKEPKEINTIVTRENIANGQRIAKYTLEAFVDGNWQPLVPANKLANSAPYPKSPGYETIGLKKIDRVEPVTTNKIRFRCTESVVGEAELRSISVYKCKPLNEKSF